MKANKASAAAGSQKTISSFFSKAPLVQKIPPSSAKKDEKDKAPTDADAGSEDAVMVVEEKNTPPASELKKRKEPPTSRNTPVQPPADDSRMRMDEDEDEGISMRKSTRRRVVPVSMAESSGEDEDNQEEEEDDDEERRTNLASKMVKSASSVKQGGKAAAPAPAAPAAALSREPKKTAMSKAADAKPSFAIQAPAATGRDKIESRLSEAEQKKMHEKFVNKVSLMRSADKEDVLPANTSVGGLLSPAKMEAGRGSKLTPMEEQVVAIKNKNPDIVLLVECGYKFKFFGRDAEIASRVLNIFHHMDHNFYVASIPVQLSLIHI